ncbi:PPOX class probable F420-dependent enzyme, Rv0121 family [Actinopolymorpha cephalotaxi]|uniref:PPOX class probable F420-dependent enzyme n=1 Tax=Actinopolymorpha cephalotaxi TaxID=504797 RepID=A0A1I2RDD3_9ACTN|nr:TIGR03668 family PPOX class F420-dependent oxidoreductase [Actinopolymorpha cephalotaxi]NYH82268.1 PPOX class probable F420-dependent enzyme [Actinopolymorpha cephalotaxi]SFG38492.1 PPOX class probable F420-dependent enzyme, Rv0121 family [Actinopolymorpha cephalotaxi]
MRLTGEEARRRFAASRTAALAMVDGDNRPHVVVVTFAVAGDLVLTAVDHKPKTTQRLHRLRLVTENPHVSLLADHYDDGDWSRLWWARAEGRAEVVTEAAERAEPVRLLSGKYAQYAETPPAGPVIRVHVERWTGWAYTE